MKKIYTLAASLLLAVGAIAQTTITSHFEGALTDPMNPQIGWYSWNGGNGFVSGTNSFGDKVVVQLFDSNYGITNSGTIEGVKVYVGKKAESGNQVDITVGIWENNSGVPGNLVGSETITLASIDTSQANTSLILDGTTAKGLYNVDVQFSSALNIPANESFFAGISLPTATEAAAGDTLVVLTTAGTYTFADASTHAGVVSATDGFDSYGASSVTVANAIFPDVTLDAGTNSIEEVKEQEVNVYPNPATSNLTFDFADASNVEAITVMTVNGAVVKNIAVNGQSQVNANISELASGMYIYQVISNDGKAVITDKIMKK